MCDLVGGGAAWPFVVGASVVHSGLAVRFLQWLFSFSFSGVSVEAVAVAAFSARPRLWTTLFESKSIRCVGDITQ